MQINVLTWPNSHNERIGNNVRTFQLFKLSAQNVSCSQCNSYLIKLMWSMSTAINNSFTWFAQSYNEFVELMWTTVNGCEMVACLQNWYISKWSVAKAVNSLIHHKHGKFIKRSSVNLSSPEHLIYFRTKHDAQFIHCSHSLCLPSFSAQGSRRPKYVFHTTLTTFVWVLHHYLCTATAINHTQMAQICRYAFSWFAPLSPVRLLLLCLYFSLYKNYYFFFFFIHEILTPNIF